MAKRRMDDPLSGEITRPIIEVKERVPQLISSEMSIGKRRENHAPNEDASYVNSKAGVLVVADGVGGHAGGNIASRLCCQMFSDPFLEQRTDSVTHDVFTKPYYVPQDPEDIHDALESMLHYSKAVLQDMATSESKNKQSPMSKMATTLSFAKIWTSKTDGKLYATAVNVGDSPVFLFFENELTVLSHEHSYEQLFIDYGLVIPQPETNQHLFDDVTAESIQKAMNEIKKSANYHAEHHAFEQLLNKILFERLRKKRPTDAINLHEIRNIITSSMSADGFHMHSTDTREIHPGTSVVITSDGVSKTLTPQEIKRIIETTAPDKIAEVLATTAYEKAYSNARPFYVFPDDTTAVTLTVPSTP